MPARLVITTTGSEIAKLFGLAREVELKARYNVAPPQPVPVIRVVNGVRELAELRWGLIPHWSSDPPGEAHVNARAETVSRKPSFRDAFRGRRGLVFSKGFQGWNQGA